MTFFGIGLVFIVSILVLLYFVGETFREINKALNEIKNRLDKLEEDKNK